MTCVFIINKPENTRLDFIKIFIISLLTIPACWFLQLCKEYNVITTQHALYRYLDELFIVAIRCIQKYYFPYKNKHYIGTRKTAIFPTEIVTMNEAGNK